LKTVKALCLSFFLSIILLVGNSFAIVDGFDYPVGIPNGQGWDVCQDFLESVTVACVQITPPPNGTHLGEDWNIEDGGSDADIGEPVYAIANGIIIKSSKSGSWGNYVMIQHNLPQGSSYEYVVSFYAHLGDDRQVSQDDTVERGQLIGTVGDRTENGNWSPHLHLELRTDQFPYGDTYLGCGYTDSVNCNYAYGIVGWLDPSNFIDLNRNLPIILQPGPSESKDIWTTSVYSYAPDGSFPGGGKDDEWLVMGGWGDLYYILIEFDLTGLPLLTSSAKIELFAGKSKGYGNTNVYLDRITEFWDWRTQGTGRDRERLWWADRPSATQWASRDLPAPTVGQWYSIDITSLYNAWQDGTYPNYGVQLRPVLSWSRWNEFYSSDYMDDPSLRPKLVIKPEPQLPEDTNITLQISETINQSEAKIYLYDNVALDTIRALLDWGGSEMKIAVYKPDGSFYGEYQSTQPPLFVEIPNAEVGQWVFEVTAIDVPYNNYPFVLVAGVEEIIPGDLDGDEDIDRDDINIFLTYRNQPASACPECDIDGDGTITALDARKIVLLCTRPRCATVSELIYLE